MKSGSFIYFDHPSAAVLWEDSDKIVRIQWKSNVESAIFRQALGAGIELITQKQGQRWLADCLKMGPVPVEDTKWATDEWTPRAIAAGVKRLAFVMPQRVVASISVMGYISGPGGEMVNMMYFTDIADARRWLREQRSS